MKFCIKQSSIVNDLFTYSRIPIYLIYEKQENKLNRIVEWQTIIIK